MRFFLSSHSASPFGAERVLFAIAEGLRKRDHEVTLEIPHDGPAVAAARRIEGIELWMSERPRLPRNISEGLRYITDAPSATWRLRRKIRDGGYDVAWVNSLMNPLAGVAARIAGPAVVWHLHERNFPQPAGHGVVRWVSSCCDVAVAISRFVAESFATIQPLRNRLRILPNAQLRTIPVTPMRDDAGNFTVTYIGQFEPRKRATDVLEAVALVPRATAVLVGDGKKRDEVTAAVRRLRLDTRVCLAGFQEDISRYFADSDCIVIPSRDEPFGLVALEAMAAGRPVIAADSGALPEVLGDAALYYPLGDTLVLAEKIEQLRAERGLAAELRERGLRRVEMFSLDRMISRVEEIAREAIVLRERR